MDRTELVTTLRDEQVPDALYDIPGVQDIPVQPDAYYYLRPAADGGWETGLRERSLDRDISRFATEDEACRDLLEKLRARPRPPEGGGESVDELLAQGEDLRRWAREEVERALRERPPDETRNGDQER
ncbi:hypothetical protein [Streptomyces sp. 11-1-2]|uniref:hypothetical protein n=1 Tax=unclassified Streptomyces TaxID=2593676 RepID=UPI000B8D7700|nr:hypothetical protein [Streptomyces sp. 11-1-2]ASQ95837.1 hypothetical protein CGL27_24695 [Streptomyces sp. 11-1-2]